MDPLVTCVIWPPSSKRDPAGGEFGGVEFIGLSKVRVVEKVLGQHKGLLYCLVRQCRRLSCQPRGDTIDLGMKNVGGGWVGGGAPSPVVLICYPEAI